MISETLKVVLVMIGSCVRQGCVPLFDQLYLVLLLVAMVPEGNI